MRSRPHVTVRALRFAVTGVLNTALHVAVAAALILLASASGALANGIAFITATVFSFFVNTYWSFAERFGLGRLARFVAVSCVGCVVTVVVAGAADSAGFGPWVGIGLVVMIVPGLTFLMHNFWTYR